jgi:hypothetical protein
MRHGQETTPLTSLVVIMKAESEEKKLNVWGFDIMSTRLAPSCGAVDQRQCSMVKRLVLAEIRKSNASAWVAEEVDTKFNSHWCRKSSFYSFASKINEIAV